MSLESLELEKRIVEEKKKKFEQESHELEQKILLEKVRSTTEKQDDMKKTIKFMKESLLKTVEEVFSEMDIQVDEMCSQKILAKKPIEEFQLLRFNWTTSDIFKFLKDKTLIDGKKMENRKDEKQEKQGKVFHVFINGTFLKIFEDVLDVQLSQSGIYVLELSKTLKRYDFNLKLVSESQSSLKVSRFLVNKERAYLISEKDELFIENIPEDQNSGIINYLFSGSISNGNEAEVYTKQLDDVLFFGTYDKQCIALSRENWNLFNGSKKSVVDQGYCGDVLFILSSENKALIVGQKGLIEIDSKGRTMHFEDYSSKEYILSDKFYYGKDKAWYYKENKNTIPATKIVTQEELNEFALNDKNLFYKGKQISEAKFNKILTKSLGNCVAILD